MSDRLASAQAALNAGRRAEAIQHLEAAIGEDPARPAQVYRVLVIQLYHANRNDEGVAWASVAEIAREHCGQLLEQLDYLETYRDEKRLGKDRKSLLFKITLRDSEGTLTGSRADEVRDRVVAACAKQLGASLRAS